MFHIVAKESRIKWIGISKEGTSMRPNASYRLTNLRSFKEDQNSTVEGWSKESSLLDENCLLCFESEKGFLGLIKYLTESIIASKQVHEVILLMAATLLTALPSILTHVLMIFLSSNFLVSTVLSYDYCFIIFLFLYLDWFAIFALATSK